MLLGAHDHALSKRLDHVAAGVATMLDLRSAMVWAEVPDGRSFVELLVQEFSGEASQVKIAFASPDATLDQLVGQALRSVDLRSIAVALEQAALVTDPPIYEIRFQPVVNLATRAIVGFESLIRASASGSAIDADELLARAERGGWLPELDQLGRTLALEQTGDWLGDGLLFLNVLAPGGIFDIAAVSETVALATACGLEADQIVLEITERNRYVDLDAATAQIDELRSLGVRIAVDDVGDGYASLVLVSRFRPDVVKISGQIIDELPRPEAKAIVSAIVQLAHQTGTWVVAEGIERLEQAAMLTAMGVDWGQGHFLGLPEPRVAVHITDHRPLVGRG